MDRTFDILSILFYHKPDYEGYGGKYGVTLARRWNNDVISLLCLDWDAPSKWHLLQFTWGGGEEGITALIGITPWFEVGICGGVFWLSLGHWYYLPGDGWNFVD